MSIVYIITCNMFNITFYGSISSTTPSRVTHARILGQASLSCRFPRSYVPGEHGPICRIAGIGRGRILRRQKEQNMIQWGKLANFLIIIIQHGTKRLLVKEERSEGELRIYNFPGVFKLRPQILKLRPKLTLPQNL